ncbi:hypothetical protein KZY67_02875 [Prevotella melaninogenica]|nr:hypothetical protein [Prevotella melaninogenica]MBW4911592.1 hypothetical protein [Prevotella melaninogenica]
MESILWSQGASPTESSTFVINGTIKREKYSESNQKAYDKLISMSELPILHPNDKMPIIKQNMFGSNERMGFKKAIIVTEAPSVRRATEVICQFYLRFYAQSIYLK